MPQSNNEDVEWLLPLDVMEIGDSFFIPTLRPALMMYIIDKRAKAARVKIKSYVATKEGCLGVRIWRISG